MVDLTKIGLKPLLKKCSNCEHYLPLLEANKNYILKAKTSSAIGIREARLVMAGVYTCKKGSMGKNRLVVDPELEGCIDQWL